MAASTSSHCHSSCHGQPTSRDTMLLTPSVQMVVFHVKFCFSIVYSMCWPNVSWKGKYPVICLMAILSALSTAVWWLKYIDFGMSKQPVSLHPRELWFPSQTCGCSRRIWRLWENLVPCDGEFHASHRTGARSRCILSSFTLCLACGDIYAPLERHMCYALCRVYSYAVAIYTTHGDIYAFLWLLATCRSRIYV